MSLSLSDQERVNTWAVKLQDECLEYTEEFCAKHPDFDRRMVRESFIIQKIAGLACALENVTVQLQLLGKQQQP